MDLQTAMQNPLISIVIPTFKRSTCVLACLGQLSPRVQTCCETSYEVIVADDDANSMLQPKLEALGFPIRLIKGPGRGPAANRNAGASKAHGEWIIFLDDDCTPSRQCLNAYLQAIQKQPQADVFEGAILEERPRQSLAEHAPLNTNGDNFWSCNFAIKKAFFEKIEGFDEAFPHPAFEDIDFAKRIEALGVPIHFVPEACVTHPWKVLPAWPRFLKQRQSSLIFLKKHPESWATMGPWMTFKITIGRLFFTTFPGFWQYKGKGFLNALMFDILDIGFSLYLACKKRSIKI